MKYIILCSGTYNKWATPRQLTKVCGETIVERTIRLLQKTGVRLKNISVTTNDERFDFLPVRKILYDTGFVGYENIGYWVDAFYPVPGPVCYLFGDVIFSPWAIKKIVSTQTEDIEFFASAPPFSSEYNKKWAEPFAFKVADAQHFFSAVEKTKELYHNNRFQRHPIAWELWQVIKSTELNKIDYTNYTVINDYTCDIDDPQDVIDIVSKIEKRYSIGERI